jgi:hypothetical protein
LRFSRWKREKRKTLERASLFMHQARRASAIRAAGGGVREDSAREGPFASPGRRPNGSVLDPGADRQARSQAGQEAVSEE